MKKRETYHHGDLRATLISEAWRVVEESGDTALSLRSCVRAIGVDIAAAYRHFRRKDEVLAAVAAQGFDEMGFQMHAAMSQVGRSPDSAIDYLYRCGLAYVMFGLQHPNLYRLMFGGHSSAEAIEAQRQSEDVVYKPYDQLTDALDLLVDASAIPSTSRPEAEFLAWSLVHGMVSLMIDGRGESYVNDPEGLADRFCRALVRGLGGSIG